MTNGNRVNAMNLLTLAQKVELYLQGSIDSTELKINFDSVKVSNGLEHFSELSLDGIYLSKSNKMFAFLNSCGEVFVKYDQGEDHNVTLRLSESYNKHLQMSFSGILINPHSENGLSGFEFIPKSVNK